MLKSNVSGIIYGSEWSKRRRLDAETSVHMGNEASCPSTDSQPPSSAPQTHVFAPSLPCKYYPKEYYHQRAAHQFFRTPSLQLHFTDAGSPLPKKPKLCAAPPDSFHSLPNPVPPLNLAHLPSTSTSTTNGVRAPCNDRSWSHPPDSQHPTHPITTAVINKGIKARFKSFSSWLLNDNSEQAEGVFKRGSLRSSLSFGGVSKLKESLSTSFNLGSLSSLGSRRKRKADDTISIAPSTGSLHSLSDGRTPWPIPWLEAVFLPEYPNKGPVNEKHFVILGKIATGAFGKVFRVSLKDDPAAVFAMKVQGKSEIISQNAVQQMKDEVSIHESVGQCAFIAQLFASWQSRSKLFTVLQYVTGYGDLYEFWKDMGPFHEDVVRIYVAEIGLALDFIHSASVVYRDLKMENIVLDDKCHVQLVDFGLAKWLGHGDRTSTICGTLDYMAPEIAHGQPYDHVVDWWSLGILVHILLTGHRPFPQAKSHLDLTYNFNPPDRLSDSAKTLLQRLIEVDPEQRLSSLCELQQELFLNSVDFNQVSIRQVHPGDLVPRLKQCASCNAIDDDFEMEDADLSGFTEQYDPFEQFDYFDDDVHL